MFNTPIIELSITENSNNFFMKRDDLLHFSFGGNKARKATYFFEDLEKLSCDCVVTYGSSSSNHCRIIANMAASKALPCYIISPQDGYEVTNNSKLVDAFGAKIIKAPLTDIRQTIDETIKDLQDKGFKPYFIQGGGHGNLGTQAYVDAFDEIHEFEMQSGIYFDFIFHASGTGTTQAGLVCGQIKHNDLTKKIVGISIARANPRGKQVVCDSITSYMGSCNADVIFIDDYIAGGYGKYDENISLVIKNLLISDGVALNTTYTGKAYYGMLEYIKENNIQNKNILFVNTGGEPLFFDNFGGFYK